MATLDVTCSSCGLPQTINVPDDHDGTRIVWECRYDAPTGELDDATGNRARLQADGCGERNVTDGPHPAEAAAAGAPPAGADLVVDGDEGVSADVRA